MKINLLRFLLITLSIVFSNFPILSQETLKDTVVLEEVQIISTKTAVSRNSVPLTVHHNSETN